MCTRSLLAVSVVLMFAACGSPHPAAPDAHPGLDAPSLPPDVEAIDAPTAPPDAPAPDLSCLGEPPTETAPDPLALSGKVFGVDHYQLAPFAGAIITLHRRSDGAVLATSPASGSDGSYAVSVATGGVAVDAYFTIAATGEMPVRVDPGDPLTTGYYALAVVANAAEVARWYADANATYAADASTLLAVAVDCNHAAVTGTTFATSPTKPVVYYDTAAMRWDPTVTTSSNGFALVPASTASESVTTAWNGMTFPAHAASAPAGVLSLVVATPHTAAQ